ncbi:hypothetical protein CLV95_11850, partial [Leptospira borgpetersenii serovar Javanica]
IFNLKNLGYIWSRFLDNETTHVSYSFFMRKVDSLKSARFNSGAVRLAVQKGAFPGTVIHYRRQVEKITKFQSSFMMVFEPGQEKAIMVALQIK